jgi:hypothetical protein
VERRIPARAGDERRPAGDVKNGRTPISFLARGSARLSQSQERGALAQLVARFHGMEEVRGSNPLSSTAVRGPFPELGKGLFS